MSFAIMIGEAIMVFFWGCLVQFNGSMFLVFDYCQKAEFTHSVCTSLQLA